MNPRGLEQAAEEQIDTIPPPLINIEQVRKRDDRVYQALFIIKSTLFNSSRSPVKILQDKLQALGLTLTVFEEDSILFCTLNRVERKMAPLSRELSGLILPHDHYGSHLDKKGNTADPQLEKKNFDFAGKTLADVWSQLVLDGHPTVAEYIEPSASELSEENVKRLKMVGNSRAIKSIFYTDCKMRQRKMLKAEKKF